VSDVIVVIGAGQIGQAIARRVSAAKRVGKRGARVDTTDPGIIFTPLAKDELSGPRGDEYRQPISASPALPKSGSWPGGRSPVE
jgi:hypothetical protein